MTLEFSNDERELLRMLVAQAVRALGPEIHHTRSHAYRDELQKRRDLLSRMLERLGGDPSADESKPA